MIAAVPLVSSALSALTPMLSPQTPSAGPASAGGNGQDFGQMIAQFSSNTVDSLKNSEAASIEGLQGKVSIQSVVESVMSAQESLQTALAIRDKAVAAYQEVSRMTI